MFTTVKELSQAEEIDMQKALGTQNTEQGTLFGTGEQGFVGEDTFKPGLKE